jgi:hypothetical protein
MSIVRIGLSESTKYGSGWDAIFSKRAKGSRPAKPTKASASKKRIRPARKKK